MYREVPCREITLTLTVSSPATFREQAIALAREPPRQLAATEIRPPLRLLFCLRVIALHAVHDCRYLSIPKLVFLAPSFDRQPVLLTSQSESIRCYRGGRNYLILTLLPRPADHSTHDIRHFIIKHDTPFL